MNITTNFILKFTLKNNKKFYFLKIFIIFLKKKKNILYKQWQYQPYNHNKFMSNFIN